MIFREPKYTGKVALKLHEYTLLGWVHPADVFVALFADDQKAFWLDREFHPTKRLSVIGHSYGGKVSSLDEVIATLEVADISVKSEFFTPGFVGWLEYPAEPKASYETATGEFLRIQEALVFDHDKRQIHMVGKFESEERFKEWTSAVLLRLGIMGGQKESYLHRVGAAKPSTAEVRHSRDEYLELIRKAQQHIAAGDVYQLCLTNQLVISSSIDPLATFLRLRLANPAPYSSFIRIGSRTLVSTSPEQFFSLSDSVAITKPIKGTRARMLDPELDANAARELQTDEKERAENLMIVDLMRNDFSKFSEEASVKVDKLFDIESYSTVHQLVSTVSGRLRSGVNPVKALLMAFPGGSMTGAPKLRAQELIVELESGNRGIYSGVSGVIGLDGSIEMAMNIRCLTFTDSSVSIGVGGGITSDSIPEAEFEEIQLKAKALLNALNASVNW